MHENLQQILETGKRDPSFTAFRADKARILVFYGCELLDTLPDDREPVRYKLTVATLYNAGINS